MTDRVAHIAQSFVECLRARLRQLRYGFVEVPFQFARAEPFPRVVTPGDQVRLLNEDLVADLRPILDKLKEGLSEEPANEETDDDPASGDSNGANE